MNTYRFLYVLGAYFPHSGVHMYYQCLQCIFHFLPKQSFAYIFVDRVQYSYILQDVQTSEDYIMTGGGKVNMSLVKDSNVYSCLFQVKTSSFWSQFIWKISNCISSTQDFYFGLNVCIPPKFICWNPNPKGDGVSRWGLLEVIRSWGCGAFMNGTSALIKVIPQSSSHPLLSGIHVRIQWDICNLEEDPHLTMFAPWSQPLSLQNCEKYSNFLYLM